MVSDWSYVLRGLFIPNELMILLIISLRQPISTFTPKYAVLASAACCLPTTWTVIYVRLKGNPNFQFSYWAQWSYIFFWPILSSTIRRQVPSYTNAMFYLSPGEQEIKIFIWGKVRLCSFFYIVNLNLYSFGPHPVGGYGCQMGQSFRVGAKGRTSSQVSHRNLKFYIWVGSISLILLEILC